MKQTWTRYDFLGRASRTLGLDDANIYLEAALGLAGVVLDLSEVTLGLDDVTIDLGEVTLDPDDVIFDLGEVTLGPDGHQ